ncbi:MAG: A24 family peptidase [Alphaproteobacteria bacterium]|nr:A24 family peptidase [Alphaproteobacteria bacterium]
MEGFIDFLNFNPAFRAGLFFVLGTCLGSFVTALQYRLPRNLNWTTDRSRCTSCKHTLGAPDLVPVFSWLFLKGRCRHCGTRIHWRYPVIELCFGLAGVVISCLLP